MLLKNLRKHLIQNDKENQLIKLTKNESEATRTTATTTAIQQEYDTNSNSNTTA